MGNSFCKFLVVRQKEAFVFFAISWGATIGLYVNHTHLHETKFQKIMVIILVISLVATLITL